MKGWSELEGGRYTPSNLKNAIKYLNALLKAARRLGMEDSVLQGRSPRREGTSVQKRKEGA